ncbi:MAG: sugar phosphate nucleotidyltransferase [Candidatus Helarchaeota archaeon]
MQSSELKYSTPIIVLAAGSASRLRPLSEKVPKALIEIDGIPIIRRIITSFVEANFSNFIVVIGKNGDKIKADLNFLNSINIEYVLQDDPRGMGDAISLALARLNSEDKKYEKFFVCACDIIPSVKNIEDMMTLFSNTGADIVFGIMRSKDNSIAKWHSNIKPVNENELLNEYDVQKGIQINDIIEKPSEEEIFSNYYCLPIYLFRSGIKKYFNEIEAKEGQEKEITAAIKSALKEGYKARGINLIKENITEKNVGKYHIINLKDIIKMNAKYLKGLKIEGYIGDYPTFIEPVRLQPGVEIGDTALLGPNVIIGKKCKLGAFCELANTIVFENVILGRECKLNWCIVDENVRLPEKYSAKNKFITSGSDQTIKEYEI